MVDHPGPVLTRLAENGFCCIMVSCFYTEQEELKNGLVTTISRIDLSDIDASYEQLKEAYLELLCTGLFVADQKVIGTEEGT